MATRFTYRQILLAGSLILITSVLLSLTLGSARISLTELFLVLTGQGSSAAGRILKYVRLPRTLAALLAGIAFSAAGAVIQSVLANPLAGPNLIGVNAGAGAAAVICADFLPALPGLLPTAAFLGALLATLLIFFLAKFTGASRITLVLAGLAIGSILSAVIDAVVTVSPDTLVGINAFRIGSLQGIVLERLRIPGVYILIAVVLLLSLTHELDILALGDETARSLGLNARLYRFLLLLGASMLAGAAVSFCGLLGFVGLIIPHAARFLVGSESRRLIPVSILAGASFVTLCDVLARVLFAPFEIPVGIVMSFIGGPFFLWLLIRKKGGHSFNA